MALFASQVEAFWLRNLRIAVTIGSGECPCSCLLPGAAQPFPNIAALLASLVPDDRMRRLHISSEANSGRIPQEQKVVSVPGFLYASSRERDNDFHCIVGSEPSRPARFINVEVSGLPPSNSPFRGILVTARNEFKAFFTTNQNALPTDGYDKYNPPVP